jgi:hypothetical protein
MSARAIIAAKTDINIILDLLQMFSRLRMARVPRPPHRHII